MCPACLRGTMTAGPDEVRLPGPIQSIELLSPDSTSGFLAAAPFDHHHSHLPLQRYTQRRDGRAVGSRCYAVIGARYVSPRARLTQAMRAVLLATATVTSRAGLRSSRPRTQVPVADGLLSARRTTEVAPTTRSRRRYPSPIFDIRPRRSLPPEEFCRGTRPRNAANWRPVLKTPGSGTLAARAVAVMMPTPGMVSRR